jgi:AIPR protein
MMVFMPLNLTYQTLLNDCKKYLTTESEGRALLGWFLENYYHLDENEVADALCDKKGDKGIDGIYVNHQLGIIDIFQSTMMKSDTKTLGDQKIKELVGTLSQITPDHVEDTIEVGNPDLKSVAANCDLVKYVKQSYTIRGIFVTNAKTDPNGTGYLKTLNNVELYDADRLKAEHVDINKTDPMLQEKVFDISSVEKLELPIDGDIKMAIAPVLAKELIEMEGIVSGDLFAWNVRRFLRSTNVNKSIADSISDPNEHKYFPVFHNGITILCRTLVTTKEKVTIAGYAVVNGCQSITNFHKNKSKITPNLRVLAKFIKIEPDSALANKITDHTNNQNGTTARDLQSNGPIQMRLQSEIHKKYPEFRYRIKRGEHPEWDRDKNPLVIENEFFGRILFAFDLEKPEMWSHNYKIMDDLHGEIFGRPEVNADRFVFLYDAYNAITDHLNLLQNKLFAEYTLTRWLLIYLVRNVLREDPLGRALCENPSQFISQPEGRHRLKECTSYLGKNMANLLNTDANNISEKTGYFDYRTELKKKDSIRQQTNSLVGLFKQIVLNKYAESFSDIWKKSEPKSNAPTRP